MLARREPVTLRSIVAGTGLSTMAVYTYFGGMPGLLGAVRQEAFVRLATRLDEVESTEDPVRDLAAIAAAYATVALRSPDLYRLMFDGSLPAPDPGTAHGTFHRVIDAAERAVSAGRFRADTDARTLANELWMLGHGACMLAVNEVLRFDQVEPVLASGLRHLYVAAGDTPAAADRSFGRGWRPGELGGE